MYSKKKIIREFAKRYGYTITSTEELYAEICDYLKYKLEKGESVYLENIGYFHIRTAPATTRYNFALKCNQEYPPRRYPFFEFVAKFKDKVSDILKDSEA